MRKTFLLEPLIEVLRDENDVQNKYISFSISKNGNPIFTFYEEENGTVIEEFELES